MSNKFGTRIQFIVDSDLASATPTVDFYKDLMGALELKYQVVKVEDETATENILVLTHKQNA